MFSSKQQFSLLPLLVRPLYAKFVEMRRCILFCYFLDC